VIITRRMFAAADIRRERLNVADRRKADTAIRRPSLWAAARGPSFGGRRFHFDDRINAARPVFDPLARYPAPSPARGCPAVEFVRSRARAFFCLRRCFLLGLFDAPLSGWL
jgi:hypothetical protein